MEQSTELRRRVAFLESRLDQVESELSYINKLLIECGFPEGLDSLKLTIHDLLGDEAGDSFERPSERPSSYDSY